MVGSKVARARPPRKIKVKDMICDMSEAYKISMVSMSKINDWRIQEIKGSRYDLMET